MGEGNMSNTISSGAGLVTNDVMSRLTSALKQNADRLANKSGQLKSDTTALSNDVANKANDVVNAAKAYGRGGATQMAHAVGSNLNVTA